MQLIAFLLIALMATIASAETITVSAAISLKDALQVVGKFYESQSGGQVTFNFDASGKLAQQISQGAPVDAFISADNDQVDRLLKSGDAERSSRRLIVRNTLVLIAPADAQRPPKSFADLVNGPGKIAIGDPRSVPAGRYAMQTFRDLRLADALAPRLVLAENVRQVLVYVQRGEVDAGIVYGTDAKLAGAAVNVVATADAALHEPIEYPAVIMTHSNHAAAATRFLDYLGSAESRAVFLKFGFASPDPRSATTGPVK